VEKMSKLVESEERRTGWAPNQFGEAAWDDLPLIYSGSVEVVSISNSTEMGLLEFDLPKEWGYLRAWKVGCLKFDNTPLTGTMRIIPWGHMGEWREWEYNDWFWRKPNLPRAFKGRWFRGAYREIRS